MPVDPVSGVILAFIIGGLGGAVSAYLGWNRSGEPFDTRKFLNGLITGVISGIALVFANIMVFKEITDPYAYLALLGTIFVGALGADRIREDAGKALAQKRTPPPATS